MTSTNDWRHSTITVEPLLPVTDVFKCGINANVLLEHMHDAHDEECYYFTGATEASSVCICCFDAILDMTFEELKLLRRPVRLLAQKRARARLNSIINDQEFKHSFAEKMAQLKAAVGPQAPAEQLSAEPAMIEKPLDNEINAVVDWLNNGEAPAARSDFF